jgi:hypothetical protein
MVLSLKDRLIYKYINKEDKMCGLMDLTGDKLKKAIEKRSSEQAAIDKKDNQENVEWSWAIEILEKHIVYKEYVRPSSLELALKRVKRG